MIPGLIRTIVPYIVGAILYWVGAGLLYLGLEVDLSGLSEFLTQLITISLAAVYYQIVRWLERNKNGKWGWLIGLASQPVYSDEVAAIEPNRSTPKTVKTHLQ